MTVYTAAVIYKGQTYLYPAGPKLPGLDVIFQSKGIVFKWGTSTQIGSQNVVVENLSGYTATIFADGNPLTQYTVGTHWWNARWRHQHAAPVIVNSPKWLMDNGWCPPWAPILSTEKGKDPGFKYTGPMSLGGVYQPMGATGERADIGLFHEGSGYWLLGGAPDSMLNYAEGLNTLPIYRIDERTGKFWDVLTYPKASVYPNQIPPVTSPYWINPGPPGVQGLPVWEVAHHPEPAFLAFMATEDVYHLETLQNTATQIFLWSTFHYGLEQPYATLANGQTRGAGHSLRTLILAWIATDYYEKKFGAVPDPMQPSSQIKSIIDNQLDFYTKTFMNNPALVNFRAFPQVGAFATWQQGHVLNPLALYAWKFPEWEDFYTWAFHTTYELARTMPAYPGPYQFRCGPNFVDGQQYDPRKVSLSDFFPDYETAWVANLDLSINDPSGSFYNLTKAQAQALKNDPLNGGNWMQANTYDMFISRNALALGVWLDRAGFVDLHTPYPKLEEVWAQQDAYAKKYWSDVNQIQPSRQAAYPLTLPPQPGPDTSNPSPGPDTSNPPIPPTPEPSTGDINMGKPVSVEVGKVVKVPFTYSKGGAPSQPLTGVSANTEPSNLGTVSNLVVNNDGTGSFDLVGATPGQGFVKVRGNGDANADGVPDVLNGFTSLTVTAALPLPDTIVVNP